MLVSHGSPGQEVRNLQNGIASFIWHFTSMKFLWLLTFQAFCCCNIELRQPLAMQLYQQTACIAVAVIASAQTCLPPFHVWVAVISSIPCQQEAAANVHQLVSLKATRLQKSCNGVITL